ncbi:MAG: YafY family transcriptional regulator [Chloroflexi bacterium]|nr:YafY family transcriptional regulator [Chloroflexota bacterium]
MRADRLLSIMLLLQNYHRLTARELARRLSVSERTIHRDMEALSGAGIPVVAERGTGGGWSLLDNYRTSLTGLTEAEIRALFMTHPPRLLADLGLDKAGEGAFIKLLAALPQSQRGSVEFMRQRIHIDPTGWQRFEDNAALLPLLQQAVWEECELSLTYRRSDGTTVERVVQPLGLVAKGSVWYLVAAVGGEPRTYRASRIEAARLTGQRCDRPVDFDLAAYWEQSKSEFVANLPRYPAVLRTAADLLPRMRAWRFTQVEEVSQPDERGCVTVHIRFEIEDEACDYVLSCGARVEVIEPPALRERVRQAARAILALYGEGMQG